MPELRKDPVIGRWVIISTERGKRPSDFPSEPRKRSTKLCPFCPNNESSTPPEVYSVRENGSQPNTPGWSLRVIPNKFPALRIEGDLNREGEGIFDKMNGIGAHEVIIETPDHLKDLANLDVEEIARTVHAYKERILDLKNDARFQYILIFKNQGEAAGASLEHSHSQLIATPIIPKRVFEEIEGSKRYYEYKERCIFCDIIRQEIQDGSRLIIRNEMFVSLAPFASRFPFEVWVLPIKHSSQFENIGDSEALAFADIMKTTLTKIAGALNNPAYNFMIHSSPVAGSNKNMYHWHVEIIPKLTRVAGFEWGTGFYINPTTPEDAAQFLRDIEVDI